MTAAIETAPPGTALGRIGGIRIRGSAGALLLAGWLVLLYREVLASRFAWPGGEPWILAVLIAVAFGVSVLLHELGHATMGRRFGLRIRWILLDALGGETQFDQDAPTPGRSALIAAAGPAVSLVLAVTIGVAAHSTVLGSTGQFVLEQLAVGNGVIAVFNLLPGLPLDGGYVVRAAVWAATGRERMGEMVAGIAGLVTAASIVLVPIGLVVGAGGQPGLLGLAILLVIAAPVARGAWVALFQPDAPAAPTMPSALALSAPAVGIAAGEPVQEALRLVTARAAAALVVMNPDGTLVGLCGETQLAGVPVAQRGLIPVAAVTPSLQPAQIIPGWLSGEQLRTHLRVCGASILLLGDTPPGAFRVLLADWLGDHGPVPISDVRQ